MQMYGMILLLAGVVMSVISSSNGGVVSSYPSYDCSGANMRDPKYRDLCLTLNKIVSALSPNSPNDINEAEFFEPLINSGIKRKDVDHVFLRFGRQM